jgi:hypothetical protein
MTNKARASAISPGRERVRAIRRRVRLESGRPDGRCGKVAEAIAAELGWAYRWGHLRLLDGGICWIHCWNQLPDGTIVDATADQFEERWLSDVVVLSPDDPLHAHYRAAPPGHLFRTLASWSSLWTRPTAGGGWPAVASGPHRSGGKRKGRRDALSDTFMLRTHP